MAKRHSSNGSAVPAVAYFRMSSDKQEASIPEQREVVERYAKANDYKLIREYADEGISGDRTEKRKDFQRMIVDAGRAKFRAILVYDSSRFGRFDSLEAGYWLKPLRDAGVFIVTTDKG